MPGMSRPVREGGIGFDYTISTSIPQKWMQVKHPEILTSFMTNISIRDELMIYCLKLLNQERDEDWSMEFIFNAMTQRRAGEKVLALNEGHDQVILIIYV